MNAIKTLLLCGVAVAALSGCDKVGSPFEALGGGAPPPDEFRVVTRKPLNMPGSASLPEPRLGERSPLEHDPDSDARAALTGSPDATSAAGISAGEAALVTAAAESTGDALTGRALSAAEAEATRNKPYEAPTLLELLNLDGEKAEDLLDPNAEARRLSTSGVATTPVNPDDAPPEQEGEDGYVSPGAKFEPKFPYGNQKRGGGS